MGAYAVRRLLQAVPALLGILVLSFMLVHLAPGDPIVALAGEYGSESYYQEMRNRFGLDRSLGEQLLIYLGNILRGDLGDSYYHGRPVAEVILSRLPPTLLLMGTALAVSSLLGIGLGLLCARRQGSLLDLGLSVTAQLGYAIPVFWLAQLLILLLALQLDIFPIEGMTSARHHYTGLRHVVDVAWHMALPASVLVVQELALTFRLTRASLLEVLHSDFVRTAWAKGLPERLVLIRHALRNALLSVVTVIGGRVGFLFAGAVLTETVFAWPGLGRLIVAASQARDYPLILGIFLLIAVAIVVANLVTDLCYAILDPRIRYR